MLVWRTDALLVIQRRKPPFGFAPPAGHVDEDSSFEEAAVRELREEVGLIAEAVRLIREGRKNNACRRKDGTWHYWKIFEVQAAGDVERGLDETIGFNWLKIDDIRNLARRTEQYLAGQISETEWQLLPGLEPVWYEWFQELEII